MARKKKNKEEGYLSNREMYEEILRCQENDVISDELGKMFMIIAKRYASKPNFRGYSYVDEMISSGVVACCAALHKFDPTRSKTPNPFSYYTSVVHNCFIQILNKERRHQEIRDELLIEGNMNPSFGYTERHSDDHPSMDSSD